MRLLRKPDTDDWQAELAARSTVAGGQPDAVASRKSASARVLRAGFWRALAPLVAVIPIGVTIFGKDNVVFVVLSVTWLCLMPFYYVAGRRQKREKQRALEPTPEERVQYELKNISYELRWFLAKRHPERGVYERWLNDATKQLELLSPEVAARWARPDRGRQPEAEVSATELSDRRTRLLELYTEVAPPEKAAQLTADLPQAPRAPGVSPPDPSPLRRVTTEQRSP